MLRRYNSTNLDTIVLKGRRTTIGAALDCDIVLKGKGIAQVHASIESNSAGYFLKDISLSGRTRVNDKQVVGQVQIHSGDQIQVGTAPPLVFDSEWMFGTRPNSAKHGIGKEILAQRGPDPPAAEGSSSGSILPMITGKKIHPLNHQASLSDSSLKKRNAYNRFGKVPSSEPHSLRSSASSTESHNRAFYHRSIGNNLLQRVVQLQAEVVAKDEKIRQLSSQPTPSNFLYYHHPALPPPPPHPYHLPPQAPPLQAPPLQAPPHQTPPLPMAAPRRVSITNQKAQKSFELFLYRAFVGAITSQLRQFNDRVIRHPQRDQAELFNSMCRAVDVPLPNRIVEIEKYCEAVLIDNDFEEGEELTHRLEAFIRESRREKILELTNELEVLMPLIRDAASNARENIKVCNVFTQWSRGFGDLLRKNSFSATTLFQAIEDLKTQFSDAHMSRHWLPPSITPILRLAALELEKRDGDITPSMSPRPQDVPKTALERKNSIDMTLDTCLSQVETIVHEMDYHLVRLYNKAKDYSTFQTLDLDTVTRISKLVDSMKSSVFLLQEHSFKDERPNSVMFFEITNDDIKKSIKKSDSEGSTSSLGSQKKVSAPPKNAEIFSEDEEILEERREVESEIMRIIGGIGGKLGEVEEPKRDKGMISVDATVLKTLLQQSQRLLTNYQTSEIDEAVRRKRSAPPTIFVEDDPELEDVVQEVKPVEAEKVELEDVKDSENTEEVEKDSESLEVVKEESEVPEAPICAKPLQKPESFEIPVHSENSENLENSENPETSEIPKSSEDSENFDKPETSEDPEQSDKPETSEKAENSENPGNSENPKNSENLENFENSENTEKSENSENSENTENPEKSENRDTSDNPKNPENSENPDVTSSEIPSAPPESPQPPESSEDVAISIEVPPLALTSSEDPTTPEIVSPRTPEDVEAKLTPENPNFGSTSSESEKVDSEDVETPKTPKFPKPDHVASGRDLPFTLIMPEQPGNPPGSKSGSFEEAPVVEDVPEVVEEKSEEEEEESEDVENEEDVINDDSESDDEKSTIRYIPSESTPQELTPQNSEHSDDVGKSMDVPDEIPEDVGAPEDPPEAHSDEPEADPPENISEEIKDILEDVPISEDVKPIGNGHVLRGARSADRVSSHLRSHFNTANGKPNVTYQYPIRRYYSPPMKRRSKSEDIRIKETLRNRPPFVLY